MTARFWILIVLLAAVVAGLVFLIPRLEGTEPEIGEIADLTIGRAAQPVTVTVSDEGSGLRSLEIRVVAKGDETVLEQRHFPGDFVGGGQTEEATVELRLDAESLELPDGEATLVVVARDWSLRDGLDGNAGERRAALTVDTVPPRLSVRSGLTYVHRGGSAAVVYEVGEPTEADGVRVGDAFFPGYPLRSEGRGNGASDATKNGGSRSRIAIFAIPVEAPSDPGVKVIARDAAGNESEAGFAVRIVERKFEKSDITLGEAFLHAKVRPLAEANGLAGRDIAESFRHVNEELRARNEDKIRAVVERATARRHWQGAFEQMRNSQVTSRFAERRSYWWNKRPISNAIHYGFDLASTRGAAVTASNAGVVAFADDLGIYGRCVIVDHGLGVHSLYAHLSSIEVKEGDVVARGEELGRSGATGLAGGDHLHFAILVGGEYVDPVEWWDPKWVRSHIEWRIDPEAASDG